MKMFISTAQINLFFKITGRLKEFAKRENESEMLEDIEKLENCANQWLRKFGLAVEQKGKAEHQLSLVSRG